MSLVSVADIVKLGQGAYKLWEFGFSKCKNAEKQYADFGSDIQYLSRNLQKLSEVIKNVNKQVDNQVRSSSTLDEQKWDRTALLKICGHFGKTIEECDKLLKSQREFGRGRGGFITNIQWNLTIEPEVRRLKDRVAFHNIKIQTVLKPLELTLMLDLGEQLRHCHGDLASRITNVHGDLLDGIREILRHVEGRWTSNVQEASQKASEAAPELPRVPPYMDCRFERQTKASHPEITDDAAFPFYSGINAFHHHFEQSTVRFMSEQTSNNGFFAERTPEPTQYLELFKSTWILHMMKKGEEFVEASKECICREYMKELENKCLREHMRFSSKEDPRKTLIEPVSTNISMLRDEEFRIWLDGDDEDDGPNAATNSLDEILRVTLDCSIRNRKQELILSRKNDTKLQMQNFSSRTTGPPNREIVREGINLERAYLVPLYANPRSLPRAMNIVFRGDENSEEDTSLSFFNLHDLLRFQQAITGYNVVFDDPEISSHLFQSTGAFRGKHTNEVGRIQIWSPRRLEKPTPEVYLPAANSSQQRFSSATSSSAALSATKTYSTAHTSPFTTRNLQSYTFEYPSFPILVLYLRQEGSEHAEMSLLTIQMDPEVKRRTRCDCARKKRDCIHCNIYRSSNLQAQRITARKGHQINLARIGKYRAPKAPEFERKLEWLHIDFDSKDKREKFEKKFDETIKIYKHKVHCYHEEMKDVKRDHVGSADGT